MASSIQDSSSLPLSQAAYFPQRYISSLRRDIDGSLIFLVNPHMDFLVEQSARYFAHRALSFCAQNRNLVSLSTWAVNQTHFPADLTLMVLDLPISDEIFLSDMLMILMAHKLINLDVQDSAGYRPLEIAIALNRPLVVKRFLEAGANLALQDKFARNCLHQACLVRGISSEILSNFLTADQVNMQDGFNKRPLYYLAQHGSVEQILLLLNAGALSDLGSGFSLIPYLVAEKREDIPFMSFSSVILNTPNADGETGLQIAVKRGLLPICQQLIQIKVIDAPNHRGRISLHLACQYGQVSIVKYLLEQGFSQEVRDDLGYTPKELTEQPDITALFI